MFRALAKKRYTFVIFGQKRIYLCDIWPKTVRLNGVFLILHCIQDVSSGFHLATNPSRLFGGMSKQAPV